MSDYDDAGSDKTPPMFMLRNSDENAIEGNYEWESDPIECDEAFTVAADHLGPIVSADILARHWLHSGRAHDIVAMAEHLLRLVED